MADEAAYYSIKKTDIIDLPLSNPTKKRPSFEGLFCTAYQSRTDDLLRERQMSWTTRRMRLIYDFDCKSTPFSETDKILFHLFCNICFILLIFKAPLSNYFVPLHFVKTHKYGNTHLQKTDSRHPKQIHCRRMFWSGQIFQYRPRTFPPHFHSRHNHWRMGTAALYYNVDSNPSRQPSAQIGLHPRQTLMLVIG